MKDTIVSYVQLQEKGHHTAARLRMSGVHHGSEKLGRITGNALVHGWTPQPASLDT